MQLTVCPLGWNPDYPHLFLLVAPTGSMDAKPWPPVTSSVSLTAGTSSHLEHCPEHRAQDPALKGAQTRTHGVLSGAEGTYGGMAPPAVSGVSPYPPPWLGATRSQGPLWPRWAGLPQGNSLLPHVRGCLLHSSSFGDLPSPKTPRNGKNHRSPYRIHKNGQQSKAIYGELG